MSTNEPKIKASQGEVILYQSRVEVRLENETVWLSQAQLSELFDKDRRAVAEHIQNIFTEKELEESSVCRKFQHAAADGQKYTPICHRFYWLYWS